MLKNRKKEKSYDEVLKIRLQQLYFFFIVQLQVEYQKL